MTTIAQQIAALEARRSEIYAAASDRWLSQVERAQLAQFAAALDLLWALRRQDLARQPVPDHELIVVGALTQRAVG